MALTFINILKEVLSPKNTKMTLKGSIVLENGSRKWEIYQEGNQIYAESDGGDLIPFKSIVEAIKGFQDMIKNNPD